MDKAQLCGSLMKWLHTFELEAPHQTLDQISDGVAMAQALNQIDPDWFSESWMSKIKRDVGTNWRLKVSNLKKIVEGIVDYYQDSLNQQLEDFSKPDVMKIGENCDATELGRLLQLILGCAVNCNHKQHYITQIMAMEEAVQQVIMQSIQELERSSHGMNCSSIGLSMGLDTDCEPQVQKLLAELEAATEARDQMAQRCHQLDMQVTLLQEEKAVVSMENRKLQSRLQEFETLEDATAGTGHRYKEVRKQNVILKEEMFKIETSRDDYRLKVEVQEKELLELQSKLEESQKMADEARHLKDELDILRETADKVPKYEATITSYKKKLEEFSDLKRQVKILEEKNSDYMQQTMELEEELKKSVTWKPQLELYKKQNADLHQRLIEETKRADKSEFESRKFQEKLHAIQREKERLIVERDSLKETNEELKCTQLQQHGNCAVLASAPLFAETTSDDIMSPEIKENLTRLQHESKARGLEEDRLPKLEALLDEATQQVNQLQIENRLANERIMELESEMEELQQERADGGTAGMRQHLAELQGQLRAAQGDKDRKLGQLEEKESAIAEYKQKLLSVQDVLKRKEQEIQCLDERYRKYVEKAKNVIKSLDPKHNSGSAAEVAVLRNQLLEKHKIIEDMEEEKEQHKLFREMEEKLMVSAFYKLGLVRQRESVDHRLAALSSAQGQSFLARQRQTTTRRVLHNFESR